jgi:coiled-coil domain-containing protein 61
MLSHNNINYKIHIKYTTTQSIITLESNEHCYKGIYTPGYIEQITSKTGNFKSYKIFMEMMEEAIHSSSRLKLELLKAKELGLQSDKMYLVLTYAVAYDRIHYPLPLLKCDQTNGELGDETLPMSTLSQLTKITRENDQLRHLLKQTTPLTPDRLDDLFDRVESIQKKLNSSVTQTEFRDIVSSFKKIIGDFRGYKVVKSEPLGIKNSRTSKRPTRDNFGSSEGSKRPFASDRKDLKSLSRDRLSLRDQTTERQTALSRTGSRDSRTSPKPFKRFNPTEYIKERNQKRRCLVLT